LGKATRPASAKVAAGAAGRALDLLREVELGVTAELGRRQMFVKDLLALTPGTVIELERSAGAPIDVLVNGTLREGDTIVVSTMEGPVVTSIRALLTPPPNREMRVKSEYIHHETLSGAIGIKVRQPSPCSRPTTSPYDQSSSPHGWRYWCVVLPVCRSWRRISGAPSPARRCWWCRRRTTWKT
jgi:hypothetical protein